MKDELKQKLMADAQARWIDINAIPWLMQEEQPMMDDSMWAPEMQQWDLVSFVQSIGDWIASASEQDVLDMIMEIINIKKSGMQPQDSWMLL